MSSKLRKQQAAAARAVCEALGGTWNAKSRRIEDFEEPNPIADNLCNQIALAAIEQLVKTTDEMLTKNGLLEPEDRDYFLTCLADRWGFMITVLMHG
jgi:hypothetical protein